MKTDNTEKTICYTEIVKKLVGEISPHMLINSYQKRSESLNKKKHFNSYSNG